MYKTFEEIMNLALAMTRTDDTRVAFTSAFNEVASKVSNKGTRIEARAYGESHPEDMVVIGAAWITAMDFAYHEGTMYMDGRNRVACTRCHELRTHTGVEEFITSVVSNDSRYKSIYLGLIKYTLVQMHRTNIQIATQLIMEGFQVAVQKLEDTTMAKILGDFTSEHKNYFTLLPFVYWA